MKLVLALYGWFSSSKPSSWNFEEHAAGISSKTHHHAVGRPWGGCRLQSWVFSFSSAIFRVSQNLYGAALLASIHSGLHSCSWELSCILAVSEERIFIRANFQSATLDSLCVKTCPMWYVQHKVQTEAICPYAPNSGKVYRLDTMKPASAASFLSRTSPALQKLRLESELSYLQHRHPPYRRVLSLHVAFPGLP